MHACTEFVYLNILSLTSCFNVLFRVFNPTFSLHAIEKKSDDVRDALMSGGVENAVNGPTTYLLLSDASVL